MVDGHPVHPRLSIIGANPPVRAKKVLRVAYLLHQIDCQGSLLFECRKLLPPSMLRGKGPPVPPSPWCWSPFCCSALIEIVHLLLALKIRPFARLGYFGLC